MDKTGRDKVSEIRGLSLSGSRVKTSDRQHMLDVLVMREGETRLSWSPEEGQRRMLRFRGDRQEAWRRSREENCGCSERKT